MKAAADEGKQGIRRNASHGQTATGDKGDDMNVLFAAPIVNYSQHGPQATKATIAQWLVNVGRGSEVLILGEYCEYCHRRFRQY